MDWILHYFLPCSSPLFEDLVSRASNPAISTLKAFVNSSDNRNFIIALISRIVSICDNRDVIIRSCLFLTCLKGVLFNSSVPHTLSVINQYASVVDKVAAVHVGLSIHEAFSLSRVTTRESGASYPEIAFPPIKLALEEPQRNGMHSSRH